MFTVYAIYNPQVDKIYIGQTQDLDERLLLHEKHIFANSYTARYPGSWSLIYKEFLPTRVAALKREKQLKSYRGREFIRSFIPR